jgi:CBS domain-containing protein
MTRAPTVGDRMAPEPIVIEADASLTTAAQLLDRIDISGLPVVDHSGALVGVLSQSDLARARSTEHIWTNWPGLRVRHLMTAPAVTVTPATPLALAIRKMERLRIHRLVVVGEGDPSHPVGVLSLTDVVHEIVESRAGGAVSSGDRIASTEAPSDD